MHQFSQKLLTVLSLTALLTACSEPIFLIPGGQLKGEIAAVPATWTSVPDVVQLETRPSDPYSVNLWALVENGNLYLATDNANWLPYIAVDDRVRIKADGVIYELRASKVTDPAELGSLASAYQRKYDYNVDNESFDLADAFKLTAR